MSDFELTHLRIAEGRWLGTLTRTSGTAEPALAVTHEGAEIEGIEVILAPDRVSWLVRVPIPSETISDGVQTYVVSDRHDGTRLTSFALLAGAPLADDIRAEVDLLRAELDMLKRAFRRHCVETG